MRSCRCGARLSSKVGRHERRRTTGLLTADMKRVVEEQRLGFVATVCPDGTPNLSPKGTTAVWDDDHLVFANIRSPGTLANLRQNANVEATSIRSSARAIASRGSALFSNPERSMTRRSPLKGLLTSHARAFQVQSELRASILRSITPTAMCGAFSGPLRSNTRMQTRHDLHPLTWTGG